MTERYQAGIVHQSINMEPQNEGMTARPESGARFIHVPEPVRRFAQTVRTGALAGTALVFAVACGSGEAKNPNVTPPPRTVAPTADVPDNPTPSDFTVVPITRTPTEAPTTVVPKPTEAPTDTATPDPTDTVEPTETREPTTVVPTVEPTTPVPTETEDPTKTPRPTKTPAPTDTPTATETSVESELPYEIASNLTVGNVTLAVTKDMQERTECGDPYGRDTKTACPAMQELYLNTDDFPDAGDKLQEGVNFGLYRAWQEQGQGDKKTREKMTFDEFKTELDNERGQDLSFQVSGLRKVPGGANSVTGLINVDPRKPLTFVWIAQPDTYSTFDTGFQIGVREANGEQYVEIFDITAGGIEQTTSVGAFPYKYRAAFDMTWALVYAANKSFQISSIDNGVVKNAVNQRRELDQYFIPEKSDAEWNGIVRAK